MSKYPLGSARAEACYSESKRALYRDNPWIEALPETPSDRDLFALLQGENSERLYDESERELDAYERRECIQSLSHVFIPIGGVAEITRKVFAAIREGYVSRNPLQEGWIRSLGGIQRCIHDRDESFSSLSGNNANACGFCVVGDSGMGKTSAVNHALRIFPQVILHQNYKGAEFHCAQLVWMRLECPQDASVKGLCSEFFMEFDKIFDENTFAKFASGGRATVDQMIPQMAFVAQRHGLGMLVIDEIQNLSEAKSGGAKRMLNFIKQLVNTIGLPVLLVGTPPAMGLLSTDLMTARRSAGQQGISYLRPLKKGSPEWEQFIRGIWKYQWTTDATPLTEELKDIFYQEGLGNIDMTVKLYMESQRIAIARGLSGRSEIITPDIVRRAASGDAFAPVVKRLQEEHAGRQRKPARALAGGTKEVARQSTDETGVKVELLQTMPKKKGATPKTGKLLLEELERSGRLVKPEDEF